MKKIKQETFSELSVSPNPTSGIITVQSPQGASIELYDPDGRRVFALKRPAKKQEIDLSGLSPGIYILKSGTQVRKIVKE